VEKTAARTSWSMVGGVVPAQDYEALKAAGAETIFRPAR